MAQEAQRTAQDTLEGLCLSAGLGTPWAPPIGAGGGVWGEGSLGVSTKSGAPATQFWIKWETMSMTAPLTKETTVAGGHHQADIASNCKTTVPPLTAGECSADSRKLSVRGLFSEEEL
ncbi:hypothetical protein CHARACLAT_026589 [Characodon lateralis]|uniref:Uncharacterized protein n=1 Tax=Characodon lateralis TaxID=208331 RepID=A0ABU7E413_9TELE|nr:hypothetical protein [Characodon lateralis]